MEKKKPREEHEKQALYLVRFWNDLSILIIVVMSAWAFCTAPMAPLWPEEIHPSVDWSCLVASIMTGTAVIFELSALIIEYSPVDLPSSVNTGESQVMLFVYTCLSVSYFKMAVSGNQWVHTDPLAFGGPRPVYTLRYLEWSIAMPLLISLSGTEDPEEDEGLDTWAKQSAASPSNSFAGQVSMLVNLPAVVGEKLLTAPLAASARCTAVYIWVSWLAIVVTDEFTRWLLLSAAFAAYGVATIQQGVYWWYQMHRNTDSETDWSILVVTEAILATHYGVIYLLAVFGCISWQYEQLAYTYSDIFAKLFHSIYLVSSRRRRNLLILDKLRAGSQLAAADLQRMISQANVPIFCVNHELRIEEWNQKIEELTGVTRAGALNRHLPEFYSTKSTSWWNDAGQLLQSTLSGEDSGVVEMQFSGQLGKTCVVAVSATCQRTAKGDIKGAVCIGQDVTELTMEKMRAENLAERLESLIQSANAPIFELDLDLRVVRWNSWLVERTGMSLTELLGKPIFSVLCKRSKKAMKDAVERTLAEVEDGSSAELFEIGLVDSVENVVATLLLTVTHTLAVSGQTIGVICIGQDITKLKDLEERKASIMAMLSHELKSPLHGITGLSSSLMEDSEVPGSVKRPLSMIQNCAARLLDMVSNIMDASVLVHDRKMRMSKDQVQLQNIVEEVITLCHNSSGEVRSHALSPGVKLQNLVTQPLPVIVADAYRVTQVIYNLVTNAMKFTHEGSITVCGSYDETKQQVMIDVKDTGIGISSQNIERIFQPFDQEDVSESRRYGGLGLGLAISREIVLKHGGEMTVKSQQGKGSTFRVILPYAMAPQPGVDEEFHGADRALTTDSAANEMMRTESRPPQVGTASTIDDRMSDKTRNQPSTTVSLPSKKSPRRKSQVEEPPRVPTSRSSEILPISIFPSNYVDLLPPDDATPVVLSVDDDDIHQQIILAVFKASAYEVVQASDVSEAAQYIRKNRLPSVVLLDVMIPDTSGLELLKSLRQSYPLQILPIIMVSAKGNKDTIAGCFQLGANDYVQKPFGKKELQQRVRLQLEISRKERESVRSERFMHLKDEPSSTSELRTQASSYAAVPSVSSSVAEAAAAKWLEVAAAEMKNLREERDQALKEAKDLRQKIQDLENTAKDSAKLEERRRQVKDFLKRQQALLEHQDRLSVFMEQLDRFQTVQRNLVAASASEEARHFSMPLSLAGYRPPEGPVGESLRELQVAEQVLHASLSRMTELCNSLTGDIKEEMLCLVASLRKDMGNLLLNMGRKCYLLLDAQSRLEDQALQLHRLMPPLHHHVPDTVGARSG